MVYYPRLFHYFHLAYEDFFHTALDFPFQRWFEGQDAIAAPITHAEARFLAPLRHGDMVEAAAWLGELKVGGWTWIFELRVENEVRASGKVKHAFVRMDPLRRAELPEEWRERVLPWLEVEGEG